MSKSTNETDAAAKQSQGKVSKYLTFALGREEYGLEILKVREIIGYMDVTSIPRMPNHVKGVINLRGQVISVIDLRARFGMEPAQRTEETCIIVVEIHDGHRRFHCGVVVDRVSEVLNIGEANIEDPPEFGGAIRSDFIVGMGIVNKAVKILLDLDKVLAATDAEIPSDLTLKSPAIHPAAELAA